MIPLRIPGGWGVEHNDLARDNDSEDLLWLRRLPVPGRDYDETRREQHIDVGWYRDHYRMVLLDPDWDHIAVDFRTTDFDELVTELERWLVRPPGGARSARKSKVEGAPP